MLLLIAVLSLLANAFVAGFVAGRVLAMRQATAAFRGMMARSGAAAAPPPAAVDTTAVAAVKQP